MTKNIQQRLPLIEWRFNGFQYIKMSSAKKT